MIRSNSLKISILLCHALIIMLEGHGFAPLGFVQFYYLADISNWTLLAGDDPFEKYMFIGSLSGVVGYLFIPGSCIRMSRVRESWMLISGIILLWGSLVLWKYASMNKAYMVIPVPLMLPLAYCTIRMMSGRNIQRGLARLNEKM
ncbi:hypothetical protein LZZ85_07315 [Terrimonas sp. NA20]|uniref:Uncharacterized protein n=1 Tax=Terrimonas ginsenosidimutans TaxID=2908004 RepID=A0ABS9KP56_9BACT|nr:hypothetical protein [Terrimonas ginsenosidimutans]MCG2614084.1 hypothetical protein [Terrimonas ginsenosidimutans]